MKKSLRKLAIMTLAVVMAMSMLGTTTAQAKKKKSKPKKKVQYQVPTITDAEDVYLTKDSRVDLKVKNATWCSAHVNDPEESKRCYEGYVSVSNKGILTVNKTPDEDICFWCDVEVGNKKYKRIKSILMHIYPDGCKVANPYGSEYIGGVNFPYTIRFGEYNNTYNMVYYQIKNITSAPLALDIKWEARNKTGELMAQGWTGNCDRPNLLSFSVRDTLPDYVMPGEVIEIPVYLTKDKTDYKNWDYSMKLDYYNMAYVYWQPKNFSCEKATVSKSESKYKDKKDDLSLLLPFSENIFSPNNRYARARISFMKNGKEVSSFVTAIEKNKVCQLSKNSYTLKDIIPSFDDIIIKPTITPIERDYPLCKLASND